MIKRKELEIHRSKLFSIASWYYYRRAGVHILSSQQVRHQLSIILVEAVKHTFAPRTASLPA
jgi:hypothetical protein